MSVDAVLSRIEDTCRKAKAAVDADREPRAPRKQSKIFYLPMGIKSMCGGGHRWTRMVDK